MIKLIKTGAAIAFMSVLLSASKVHAFSFCQTAKDICETTPFKVFNPGYGFCKKLAADICKMEKEGRSEWVLQSNLDLLRQEQKRLQAAMDESAPAIKSAPSKKDYFPEKDG